MHQILAADARSAAYCTEHLASLVVACCHNLAAVRGLFESKICSPALFLSILRVFTEDSVSALQTHYQHDVNAPAVFRSGEAPLLHLPADTVHKCFIGAAQTGGRVNIYNRTIFIDSPFKGKS